MQAAYLRRVQSVDAWIYTHTHTHFCIFSVLPTSPFLTFKSFHVQYNLGATQGFNNDNISLMSVTGGGGT